MSKLVFKTVIANIPCALGTRTETLSSVRADIPEKVLESTAIRTATDESVQLQSSSSTVARFMNLEEFKLSETKLVPFCKDS